MILSQKKFAQINAIVCFEDIYNLCESIYTEQDVLSIEIYDRTTTVKKKSTELYASVRG